MDTTHSVLKNKNYVLTLLGALVSNVGSMFYSFAVGFYILELSGNNAMLQGTYLAVNGIVFIICAPFGGVLADRWHKGRTMAYCDFIKGSFIILGALLISVFSNSSSLQIAVLFTLGVISNMDAAVLNPAASALIPLIVDDDQLQQANSYHNVLSSFQSIVGVILAGIFYSILPVRTLFIIVGVCYLLSGLSELFIKYEHKASGASLTVQSVFSDIKEGFVYACTMRPLMILIGMVVFINFFFTPVTNNFTAYFIKTDVAGAQHYIFDSFISPEMWNSVMGVALSAGSLVTGIFMGSAKQKDSISKGLKTWISVIASLLVANAFLYHFLVKENRSLSIYLLCLTLGCIIIGVSLIKFNVPVHTKIQLLTDEGMLGKVSSIISIATQGLIPLASFLAGICIDKAGPGTLLFICAGGFTVTAIIMYLSKTIKEL